MAERALGVERLWIGNRRDHRMHQGENDHLDAKRQVGRGGVDGAARLEVAEHVA